MFFAGVILFAIGWLLMGYGGQKTIMNYFLLITGGCILFLGVDLVAAIFFKQSFPGENNISNILLGIHSVAAVGTIILTIYFLAQGKKKGFTAKKRGETLTAEIKKKGLTNAVCIALTITVPSYLALRFTAFNNYHVQKLLYINNYRIDTKPYGTITAWITGIISVIDLIWISAFKKYKYWLTFIFLGLGGSFLSGELLDRRTNISIEWIVLFVIGLSLSAFFYILDIKKLINDKKEKEEQKKNKQTALYKELYKRCSERDLRPNGRNDAKILDIASNLGIEKSHAIEAYKLGEQATIEEQKRAEKERKEKAIQEQREAFEKQRARAEIYGMDKYRTAYCDILDKFRSFKDITDALRRVSDSMRNSMAIKHDWAILGGIADGIAGPIAGIATAIDVQNENAKAEQSAKARREYGSHMSAVISDMEIEANRYRKELEKIVSSLNLLNFGDMADEADKVEIKVDKYSIDHMTNNMILNISTHVDNPVYVNSKTVALDGSFLIEILLNDKVVGKAYYSAPGFDTCVTMYAGFDHPAKETTIGISNSGIFEEGDYIFRFTPIALWGVEIQRPDSEDARHYESKYKVLFYKACGIMP